MSDGDDILRRERDLDDAHLRSRVALMRELGVIQWEGILLGPPPPPPPAAKPPLTGQALVDEIAANDARAKRKLFGASGVHPK